MEHTPSRPLHAEPSQRLHPQSIIVVALTVVGLVLSSRILLPFLPAFAWSLALSVVAYPTYVRLLSKIKHGGTSAACIVAAMACVFILPTIWVCQHLAIACIEGLQMLLPVLEKAQWSSLFERYPPIAQSIAWLEQNLELHSVASGILEGLRYRVPQALISSGWLILQVMLCMFIAFFLLRDGPLLLSSVNRFMPLNRTEQLYLIRRMRDTIHATLFGVVAVALLQGSMGGLIFWWLALPAPLIWGAIMTLLAVVPYLGTFVVWAPTAVFLAVQGSWSSAILLTLWGAFIIGLSDNLVYPMLVGRRLHYHTMIVFFFLLGGIFLFGSCGLVLGPMILVATDTFLRVSRRRFGLRSKPREGEHSSPPLQDAHGM